MRAWFLILVVLLSGCLQGGQKIDEKEDALVVRLSHSYPLWQYQILSEAAVDKVRSLPGVLRLVEYHIVEVPWDDKILMVVGVEFDSVLRVPGDGDVMVRAVINEGRSFEEEDADKNVAILGDKTLQELRVGSSFVFPGTGEKVEVIGRFLAIGADTEETILLPAKTAERLVPSNGVTTLLYLALSPPYDERLVKQVKDAFMACPIMIEEEEISIRMKG